MGLVDAWLLFSVAVAGFATLALLRVLAAAIREYRRSALHTDYTMEQSAFNTEDHSKAYRRLKSTSRFHLARRGVNLRINAEAQQSSAETKETASDSARIWIDRSKSPHLHAY
jgi:hypothetical protein